MRQAVIKKPFAEQVAFFRQKLGELVPTTRWSSRLYGCSAADPALNARSVRCMRPRHDAGACNFLYSTKCQMIQIQIDDREVQQALADLARRVGDLTPAMHDIGQALVEGARARIVRGVAHAPNAGAEVDVEAACPRH